jgi:hypothetical protein
MDSMLSAIRSKRGAGAMDGKEAMEGKPQAGGEMKSLVDSLDEGQKQELLALLGGSQQEPSKIEIEIEKGGPTDAEKKMIEKRAMSEQEMPESESDEVALSMIDRDSLRKAEGNVKPRGLGDRAKMAMAQKLKEKGVIK